VDVSLRTKKGAMTLAVADNGRGFTLRELSDRESLGLVGMRERASLAGGFLELQSQPGKCAPVRFTLPINSETGSID